jgi:hypothetical protein
MDYCEDWGLPPTVKLCVGSSIGRGLLPYTHDGVGLFRKKVFRKFGWHGKNVLPLVGGWVISYYTFFFYM